MFYNTDTTDQTNAVNADDLTLVCGYLEKHRSWFNGKEVIGFPDATNINLSDFIEEEILKLIKEAKEILTGDEVKKYNLYGYTLFTLCTLELKKSLAGNVMFIINEACGKCVGIYGHINLEETIPCSRTNDLPSLTCFKGFAEHGNYVGIVKPALNHTSIQYHGGIGNAYNRLGLTVRLDSLDKSVEEYFKSKYSEDFNCLKENGKVIFNIVTFGYDYFDDILKDVIKHLSITLEDLYKTKLETEEFIEQEAINNKREKPYTGIDRLYRAYGKPGNSVVYF